MEIIKRAEKILKKIDDSYKVINFLDTESMKEQGIAEESIAKVKSDDYMKVRAFVCPDIFPEWKIIFINPEKIIIHNYSNDEERVDDEIRSILYHEIAHYDTFEAYDLSTDKGLKNDLKNIIKIELLAFLYGFISHWNSCKNDYVDEELKEIFKDHLAVDRMNIISILPEGIQVNKEETIHELLENYIINTINFMNESKCKDMYDRRIISYVEELTNNLTEKLVKQSYGLQ